MFGQCKRVINTTHISSTIIRPTFLPGEELGGGGLAQAGRSGDPEQPALPLRLHRVVAGRGGDRVALRLYRGPQIFFGHPVKLVQTGKTFHGYCEPVFRHHSVVLNSRVEEIVTKLHIVLRITRPRLQLGVRSPAVSKLCGSFKNICGYKQNWSIKQYFCMTFVRC